MKESAWRPSLIDFIRNHRTSMAGRQTKSYLINGAREFSARQALSCGLITDVFPHAGFNRQTTSFIKKLASVAAGFITRRQAVSQIIARFPDLVPDPTTVLVRNAAPHGPPCGRAGPVCGWSRTAA
jgi:enoyl-CoA hydratase/carnithine racemase